MKQLKDYLHLYLGCEVETCMRKAQGEGKPMKKLHGTLMEVDLGMDDKAGILMEDETDKSNYEYFRYSDIKPLLRPLSSINKEDVKLLDKAVFGIYDNSNYAIIEYKDVLLPRYPTSARPAFPTYVRIINELRKMGFDCDNLIEAGLAINKTLTPSP